MERRILLTECQDAVGIIAKITNVCFQFKLNIIRQDQFASQEDNKFFMRTVLEGDFTNETTIDAFINTVKVVLPEGAIVHLKDDHKKKLCVLVTKEAHCLGEILMKAYSGALNADVVCVAGNYPDLGELAEKFNVPFKLVSTDGITKEEQEKQMMKVIDECNADYVILAKYMRILSPDFVNHYPLGKIINIHPSLIPSFCGTGYYGLKVHEAALERGVKITGATVHYVDEGTDTGPIIMQKAVEVKEDDTPKTLQRRVMEEAEWIILPESIGKIAKEKE